MKKNLIIIFGLCSVAGFLQAGETFSVADVDSVLANSDAVILLDEDIVRIINEQEAEHQVKRRILIFNEDGERYCKVSLNASRFVLIDDIEATLYDMNDEIIKELDDDEIEESALSPRGILYYEDQTTKSFSLTHITYPYILEYTYTEQLKSLFFWPKWYPQWSVPVLTSTYKLILETPVKYNFFKKNIEVEPKVSSRGGPSTLTWQIKNLKSRVVEDFMSPEDKRHMFIMFAPENFTLGDYKGSFASWDSMAKWYMNMARGRYTLPEDIKLEIQNMVKGIEDEREIIRLLYKYLQEKTRYVAIYLDVGGWQPHSAASVYKNRYGDCKDLSTLMVALLDAAGIKAYPALALMRRNGIVYEEFPSNQFNHCITLVPMVDDTVWLECTADYVDLDDTPYNIEGIKVLVIDENGGKLVQTPKSDARKNSWISDINGALKRNGDLIFTSKIQTTGNQKNYFKGKFGVQNSTDELLFLQKIFGKYLTSPDINQYSFNEKTISDKSLEIFTEGRYKKFASFLGKRILLNPNIFNQITSNNYPEETERTYDVYFSYPYLDVDTVSIKLPSGYTIEGAPEQHNLVHPFAKYITSHSFENGFLTYTRTLEYTTNRIPVDSYDKYRKFIKSVAKSDQSKFIFKK